MGNAVMGGPLAQFGTYEREHTTERVCRLGDNNQNITPLGAGVHLISVKIKSRTSFFSVKCSTFFIFVAKL